ncbi:MAG: hypothetical protein EOO38_05980 [Cytophagaceae bacterium]|nr:MAG: hypothetical protein EOO38_05980 [Cytophagaceae bacterium]
MSCEHKRIINLDARLDSAKIGNEWCQDCGSLWLDKRGAWILPDTKLYWQPRAMREPELSEETERRFLYLEMRFNALYKTALAQGEHIRKLQKRPPLEPVPTATVRKSS